LIYILIQRPEEALAGLLVIAVGFGFYWVSGRVKG